MSQSANKIIKKSKKTLTPAQKVDLESENLEFKILTIISSLEKIEQDIQQETYDDSHSLEQKYKQLLLVKLEEYKNISKKVDKIQWKSIVNN